MRPLPVEALAGAPAGVLGVSVVRGRATSVVDLEILLHGVSPAGRPETARFVTLRIGERSVALQVGEVLAVRSVEAEQFEALPPLWQGTQAPAVAALGTLDCELLLVLETARLLPAEADGPGKGGR